MGEKIAYEVTQPVVNGNEVLHAAGDLFASRADVPDYVQVKAVVVDVPDKPAAEDKPAPAPEPAKAAAQPGKPSGKM